VTTPRTLKLSVAGTLLKSRAELNELVQDGTEGHHRVVGPRVARLELELGPEGGVGLVKTGTGCGDSLLRDSRVRAVRGGEGDGLLEGPRLAAAEARRCHQQHQRQPGEGAGRRASIGVEVARRHKRLSATVSWERRI
jgi:hypothetical protein